MTPEELLQLKKSLAKMDILEGWKPETFGRAMARYDSEGKQRASVHSSALPNRHGIEVPMGDRIAWEIAREPLVGKWEVLIANPERGLAFHGLLVGNYQFIGLADSLELGMILADENLKRLGYILVDGV